jgi:hypothetical protein
MVPDLHQTLITSENGASRCRCYIAALVDLLRYSQFILRTTQTILISLVSRLLKYDSMHFTYENNLK